MENSYKEKDCKILNEAIGVYLSGGQGKPGIILGGGTERLEQFYPSDWELLNSKIVAILHWADNIKIDWSKNDLKTAQDFVEERYKAAFPQLTDESAKLLAV